MFINTLSIQNLRNHNLTEIKFGNKLNIIYGLNGSGKTTLLEAISIGAISKSFLPVSDSSVINFGNINYSVLVKGTNDLAIPYFVGVKYYNGKRKQINSTYGDNLTPKDIIGEIPVIILSPDFKNITFGTPQDRRQFIDTILSQSSKSYMEDLFELKKCLKQRNNLLTKNLREGIFDKIQFEIWTDLLIKTSANIMFKRNKFINEFIPFFEKSYLEVSSGNENVSITYLPYNIDNDDVNPEKDYYILKNQQIYEKLKFVELRRGVTMFGPQKDEIAININRSVAKETASQGQHKSLLISLKFAEFEFLKKIRNETPVILFDDIFSELDSNRSNHTLEQILIKDAQSIITITENSYIKQLIPKQLNTNYFRVDKGIVYNE